jgi:hypothetical protein
MELVKINQKETITSLELVEQINLFRNQEEGKSQLRHDNLLSVIRDEFEEEIGLLKIKETPYTHPQNGQIYTMYELTLSQAKQVLVRESKFVRKAIIAYIEELERQLNNNNLPATYIESLKALIASEEAKEQALLRAKKAEESNAILMHTTKVYSVTEIAKELNMNSAISLNNKLKELGIQFKVNGTWVLSAKYSDLGYESVKQIVLENGQVIYDRKFTQTGRKFILDLFGHKEQILFGSVTGC